MLAPDPAAELLGCFGEDWQVVEVFGQRSTDYCSAYFDDENFGLFHDHVKGRRLRYKVRTRRYSNSPDQMLEVKLKSGRGATDKRRMARNGSVGSELTTEERQWVTDIVRGAYGHRTVGPLHHALALQYTRRTLVNPVTFERLTVDTGLIANGETSAAAPVGGAVVIEVKSIDWHGQTVRRLQQRSLRPIRFSKYCAALASLHPDLDQRARQRAQRSFALSRT